MLAPAQNTRSLPDCSTTALTSGCSKRSRWTSVGKLDIDAEIVGVELQFIALEQAAGLVDIHEQHGDFAIILDAPMPIAARIGLEVDELAHEALSGYSDTHYSAL